MDEIREDRSVLRDLCEVEHQREQSLRRGWEPVVPELHQDQNQHQQPERHDGTRGYSTEKRAQQEERLLLICIKSVSHSS